MAAAVAALAPAAVHVVLVDHGGRCSAREAATWEDVGIAPFTRLTLDDPARLCWEVAAAVLGPLGVELSPPHPH